jgi:hypothetical protein
MSLSQLPTATSGLYIHPRQMGYLLSIARHDHHPLWYFFSASSISMSLMERSLVKSGQWTNPEASIETVNLFLQSPRHAHMEQYFFSVPIAIPFFLKTISS